MSTRIPHKLSAILFGAVALCANLVVGVDNGLSQTILLAQASPATAPSGTPKPAPTGAAQGAPAVPITQTKDPAGGQPAAGVGAQGAAPGDGRSTSSTSLPGGVVREKETKETKETKEIKEHPSELVGLAGALGWPLAVVLIVFLIFFCLAFSKTIQQFFGIAASVVQKIEIAGVKLEIDTSVVDKVKKFVGGSLDKLMKKAKSKYDKMATEASVDDRLREAVRGGVREVLRQHHLVTWPAGLRATVHVPDIVFKDYMYQLINYYPNATHVTTAGRRLSQRFGIVGRAWRLGQSMGRGRAVSGPDASNQLILFWGMQQEEADDQSHLRPANLCVMLIDADDDNKRVGLLYVDSTAPDAFGINPPPPPAIAALEAAAEAARAAAQAVADAASAAAEQQTASRLAHTAARVVARATADAVIQAADDAAVQAANAASARAAGPAATEATARVAAHAAAAAVAQAATDAAAGAADAALPAVQAVAQAATDTAQRVVDPAAARAVTPVAGAPNVTADQLALALQNHPLTAALARAVNQAMAPLRGAGPALEVTDLRNENEST